MKIWILADDRAGNVNQLLGIAEALQEPFERKDIRYTEWVKLPNMIRRKTLLGVDKASQKSLLAPWPDVVLSAGRRSFPVARFIRKQSGNKTKIVQLMNPGSAGFSEASLVVLPAHDNYRGKASNVMIVVGSPHRITPQKLQEAHDRWDPAFAAYPHKRISVIIGGATKNKPFTADRALELALGIKKLNPASVLVTTSRRTPMEVIDLLQKELPRPMFFYRFGDKSENPYFGLLACADEIVVTGDSMSMCSESCAAGIPVSIFAPPEMMGDKHIRFHQTLYRNGFAVPLGEIPHAPQKALNPAQEIAEKIKEICSHEE